MITDEDFEALTNRVKLLEDSHDDLRRQVGSLSGSSLSSSRSGGHLIGVRGLQRGFTKVIRKYLDSDDARDASDVTRFFFNGLTHDQRVRVLLSAGLVTEYIANDPMYYKKALDEAWQDRSKVSKLYNFMYQAWSSGICNHVCESCERSVETTQQDDGRWLCAWCSEHETEKKGYEVKYVELLTSPVLCFFAEWWSSYSEEWVDECDLRRIAVKCGVSWEKEDKSLPKVVTDTRFGLCGGIVKAEKHYDDAKYRIRLGNSQSRGV